MSMVNFAPARLLDIRLCLGSDTAVNGQRSLKLILVEAQNVRT